MASRVEVELAITVQPFCDLGVAAAAGAAVEANTASAAKSPTRGAEILLFTTFLPKRRMLAESRQRPGRADARSGLDQLGMSAKRLYRPWKATATVAVGPLRCLARI